MMLRNNKFEHMVYYFKEIIIWSIQRWEKFENNNKQK